MRGEALVTDNFKISDFLGTGVVERCVDARASSAGAMLEALVDIALENTTQKVGWQVVVCTHASIQRSVLLYVIGKVHLKLVISFVCGDCDLRGGGHLRVRRSDNASLALCIVVPPFRGSGAA